MSTAERIAGARRSPRGMARFTSAGVSLVPDSIGDQKAMFRRSQQVALPKYVWTIGRVQTEGAKQYAQILEELSFSGILARAEADVRVFLQNEILLIQAKRRRPSSISQQQIGIPPGFGFGASGRPLSNVVAVDESRSVIERVEALRCWITTENDAAAQYVLQQLQQPGINALWRCGLVLATEAIDFSRSNLRAEASEVLHKAAIELRFEQLPGVEHAVYCAIARYGSLVDPADANRFCEFLVPNGYVDTRLAALKAVSHLFETAPPAKVQSLTLISERITEIALKFLDRDVFASGQNSAIAKEAIVASAVLGSASLLNLVSRSIDVGRTWFRRAVVLRLVELRALWAENDVEVTHPAYEQLVSAINLIEA